MPTADEIELQQSLLSTLRRRLAYNLEQQAKLGAAAPFSLMEDITSARSEIGRIKVVLREWQVAVADLPSDSPPPAATPPMGATMIGQPAPVLAAPGPPRIRVLDTAGVLLRTITTPASGLTIGRSPDNGLVLDHEKISRYHARVGWDGSQLSFTDLGSTNGSAISGTRLPANAPQPWQVGTVIQLHAFRLALEAPAPAGTAPLSPAVATPPPAASSSAANQVGQGMAALADMMGTADVRAAVVSYQADFETASRHIEVMSIYKTLHDLFQQLEDRYYIVYHSARSLPANEAAWEDLDRNEPELQVTIDALLACATRGGLAAENTMWTQKLGRARHELRAALDNSDADQLKGAIGRLKDVLGRELSRTNTRLVSAADALRLDDLVAALQTLKVRLEASQLDASATQRLAEFRGGLEALATLDTRLRAKVPLHKAFQDVDDELRRIEALLDLDVSELIYAWPDLNPMMQAVCNQTTGDWSAKVLELGNELEAALATADPNKIRRAFRRYRSQAAFAFNQVDQELLKLCAELQKVGEPLHSVLRMIVR